MRIVKVCYSLDILHQGFNVFHFILAGDYSETPTISFLSRPSDSASNKVNALEISNGLQSSSSRTIIPSKNISLSIDSTTFMVVKIKSNTMMKASTASVTSCQHSTSIEHQSKPPPAQQYVYTPPAPGRNK